MLRPALRTCAAVALAVALAGGCGLDRLFDRSDDGARPAPTSERSKGRRRHHRADRPSERPAPSADVDGGSAGEPISAPRPAGEPSVHLALGAPTHGDGPDDHVMHKPQYALSYNRARNGANWVSWELNASYFGGEPRHKGQFLPDETLPAGWYRVRHDDYTGSDYDRGHLVRSEERTRSREDNTATFLLSNVLPQRHDLNAGPWLRLEDYCDTLARREGRELFVTAGGIFGAHPATIGHGVAVPEAFFKVAVVLDRGQGAGDVTAKARVIAVIMPNATGILDNPWGMYRTSVAEIERRTGYHFFDRVAAPVRGALEARVDTGPTG